MIGNDVPRYALAVFQDWSPLLRVAVILLGIPNFDSEISVLGKLSLFATPAVLASQNGSDRNGLRCTNEKRAELQFSEPPELLGCSEGGLARRLLQRIEQGSTSLAKALTAWMMAGQALRLADDVSRGRLLLWARLQSPTQEQEVCTALLKAGALRIEVHDLRPIPV